ncbi:hypothetical protein BB559_002511 [Furculomyces boomerangus]|uniref:Peptidase M16 N-terminal domain-containing protein n=1 Tax=Furculomyces boomerangus TaxID=61424 RepID=A0A2T9YUU9_9FUNG|nr:hypothetical protein BB559_002511 [Furculomyces boomerangus]
MINSNLNKNNTEWIFDSKNFQIESIFTVESNSQGSAFPAISLVHKLHKFRTIVCKTSGPLCQLNILVPTICSDHKGLPHTLEHLIFCGSKHFPERGYLDALASLNYSNGTNAYTNSDHTVYTLETAGELGIFNTLPVFLDGVLNPNLTPDQFVSEVYNIDKSGKKNGVVFSEMESVENTELELLDNEIRKQIYGENSMYSYNYGGLMSEIANISLSEVVDYHNNFYQLQNITLLFVGGYNTNLDTLLKVFEQNNHIMKPPPEKYCPILPTTTISNLKRDLLIKEVKFPSEDTDIGSISFGWKGPNLIDIKTRTALLILFQYLNEASSSILNQKFVEKTDPLASSIDIEIKDFEPTCIVMTFSGVPYSQNDDKKPNLFSRDFYYIELIHTLKKLVESSFDGNQNAIKDALHRFIVEMNSQFESDPLGEAGDSIISDILTRHYSNLSSGKKPEMKNKDIMGQTNLFSVLNELSCESIGYWIDLLKVDKAAIGDGIKETQSNDGPNNQNQSITKPRLPLSVISDMPPIPDTSKIALLDHKQNFYLISSGNGIKKEKGFEDNISGIKEQFSIKEYGDLKLPFKYLSYLQTETNFISLKLHVPLSGIPNDLKQFMPLFQALCFNSDLLIPQKSSKEKSLEADKLTKPQIIGYKEVVKDLIETFVSYSTLLGNSSELFRCYSPLEIFTFSVKSEPEKFQKSIKTLFESIFFIHFSTSRILSACKNMLSQILELKRDGSYMISASITRLSPAGSNPRDVNKTSKYNDTIDAQVSIYKQESFIKKIIKVLETSRKSSKNAQNKINSDIHGKRDHKQVETPTDTPSNSCDEDHSDNNENDFCETSVTEVVESLEKLKGFLINNWSSSKSNNTAMIEIAVPLNKKDGDHIDYVNIITDMWREFGLMADVELEVNGMDSRKKMRQNPNEHDLSLNSQNQNEFGSELDSKIILSEAQSFKSEAFSLLGGFSDMDQSSKTFYLASVPSMCSSYFSMAVNCSGACNLSNDAGAVLHEHNLLVLSEILSRTDGILYNIIRGNGYAYDVRVRFVPLREQLFVECNEASDINSATSVLYKVFNRLLESNEYWEQEVNDFEISLAKSSILYNEYASISSSSSIISTSSYAHFRGFTDVQSLITWNQTQIALVTRKSLRSTFIKYFCRFIDPEFKSVAFVISPRKEDLTSTKISLEKHSSDLGYTFTNIKLKDLML